MLVLFLVGTSNYVDRNIVGVLLEQIKAEFEVSDTQLGLLSGLSFALLYATLGIPVARWADRGDRRLVITLSLLVWSVMTAACGLVATFWQLLAARFGVGAGEAGAIPPAQSLLADYYPLAQRTRAIGIFMMSSSAGYAIGLIVGGFVAEHHGWRAAFLLVGLSGLVLAPLTHFVLKEPRHSPPFSVTSHGNESTLSAVRVLLGKAAYRNILAAIVVYFLMAYGAFVFIVSLMIRVHHLNVARAGAIFGAISAIGALIGSFGGGALADRLARNDLRAIPRIAGWLMVTALPWYELSLAAPSISVMVPVLFVATVLMTAVGPAMFSAVLAVGGSRRRALSVAFVLFCANLIGLGCGPIIAGALSDYLGSVYGAADGLRYTLMIAMTALLPAGYLMLRAARTFDRDSEE